MFLNRGGLSHPAPLCHAWLTDPDKCHRKLWAESLMFPVCGFDLERGFLCGLKALAFVAGGDNRDYAGQVTSFSISARGKKSARI